MKDLEYLFESSGFNRYGWTPLEKPMTMAFYKTWLDNNFHADMDYLKRHTELKEQPDKLLAKAKTAFVFTQNYFPPESENFPLKKLKVALYARQTDYHIWFQKKLDKVAIELKQKFPTHEFVAFTDSKPVLERDLAYRAGLGWIGKNSCLIHEKQGSLFFIGEIYSTLEIQTKIELHPDRCGTCTKCIDICPTQALVEPRVLDSNKCISYWTIEAKQNPPVEIRSKLGEWFYGCDLCQTICPWNQKFFKQELQSELAPIQLETDRATIVQELRQILAMSKDEFREFFKDSPMNRAKPWAHKRNAIIVAVHHGLNELSADITLLRSDKNLKANLIELIEWALSNLKEHSA